MMSKAILLFLILHFVGDYYFQTDELATSKRENIRGLLIHGLIYSSVILVGVIPFASNKVFFPALVISCLHLVVDLLKFLYLRLADMKFMLKVRLRYKALWDERIIYVIDQALHIATIIAVVYMLIDSDIVNMYIFNLAIPLNVQVMAPVLMAVVVLKPVNITFRILFAHIKPSKEENMYEKATNAGKLIGNLERLLILIFLLQNQYTAIGFIFTAKSVTRYNRISEDSAFAEYYLLGTLFSILSTLVVFLGCWLLV